MQTESLLHPIYLNFYDKLLKQKFVKNVAYFVVLFSNLDVNTSLTKQNKFYFILEFPEPQHRRGGWR